MNRIFENTTQQMVSTFASANYSGLFREKGQSKKDNTLGSMIEVNSKHSWESQSKK